MQSFGKIEMICIIMSLFPVAGQYFTVKAGEKDTIQIQWRYGFGEAGSDSGQFKNPQALSVDPQGAIYVCDTDNHRIQKFAPNGRFLKMIGGFGWKQEQFYQPCDVHARSALDVFIADYENQRIERYDRELNYISSLYSRDTWDEKFHFSRPIGLAFSNQREIFIIDDENRHVIKINSYGQPEMHFGDFDWGVGQLKHPLQIEIARDELIFVSDAAAQIILVYDYFGNYLSKWGEGHLTRPQGLFWDNREILGVVDSGNHCFLFFSGSGEILFDSKISGADAPELIHPVDLALFNSQLYVLDAAQNRIQVYRFLLNP